MTAHVAVPAIDDSGMPATLSKTILTDLLKGEMGFEGVITTDDITMGGIVSMMEVADAVIQSLKAGSDLILLRDDSSLTEEVMAKVREAAESGDLPMERIEDAVRRTLRVKYDYGMFDNLNIRPVEEASSGIEDPKVEEICVRAAKLTTMVHRDRNNAVPVSKDARVLLIEQFNPLQEAVNDMYMHPGLLWKKMSEISDNVGCVEITMDFTEDDKERITRRLDEPDVFVITNVYWRRAVADSSYNDFILEIQKTGKPVIVVTNNHYPYTCRDEFDAVILSYSIGPEGMAETARLLFGEQ
jgi:beta-N-acetylhexosaminidase